MTRVLTALATAAVAGACGSGDEFSGDPIAVQISASGALRLELRTTSSPPTHGTLTAQITVSQVSNSAPIDGLELSVVPWMPSMGHGSSVAPTVTAEGGGRYRIADLELFMAGSWQLRVTMTGTAQDTATIEVEVH